MTEATTGSGPPRCVWCAGTEGDLTRLRLRVPDQIALNRVWVRLQVHPRHERPVRRFLARFRRDGRRFVLSIIAWFLLAIVLVTVGHALELSEAVLARWEDRLLGPYMIGVGSTFLVFPFATPLTNRWLGIRTSVLFLRGMGGAMSAFGLWKLAGHLF